jgi:hypothetical protein
MEYTGSYSKRQPDYRKTERRNYPGRRFKRSHKRYPGRQDSKSIVREKRTYRFSWTWFSREIQKYKNKTIKVDISVYEIN